VRCADRLDVAGIERDRLNILAEAVAVYKAAASCPSCASARMVDGQLSRCPEHRWWLAEAGEVANAAAETADPRVLEGLRIRPSGRGGFRRAKRLA
jgi:predicted anti-sigma-YlaC factor YlaD